MGNEKEWNQHSRNYRSDMYVDLHKDKKQIFHPTAKIPLPPDPIEDISTHFTSSTAKLQGIFTCTNPMKETQKFI